MSKVYFIPVDSGDTGEISEAAKKLTALLMEESGMEFAAEVPLKVHFGEAGNKTYVPAVCYDGVIDLIEAAGKKAVFIETNVLYHGERMTRESHEALAADHGFTRIPIKIADGERGEAFTMVEINKKQFQKCKIGKAFEDHEQIIIAAHFKGHMLAGFGGAMKQLAMGCAARGGKLDQHAGGKPLVNPLSCTACGTCAKNCPVDAITIKRSAKIDKKVCIGCAGCIAVCKFNAMKINWAGGMGKTFMERVAEYAYAAQLGKKNIYINYAINLTKHCDCMGNDMKPIYGDLGVLASTDPVALDKATWDTLKDKTGRKPYKGHYALEYAEGIGLGSMDYELETL